MADEPSPTIRALALVTAYSGDRQAIGEGPWADICADELTDPVGIIYGLCTLAHVLAGVAAVNSDTTVEQILSLIGTAAATHIPTG